MRARLPICAILIASTAAVGCNKGASAKPVEETESKAAAPLAATPRDVEFKPVTMRKVPRSLQVSGSLDPDERSEVAAQTAGTVLRVLADVGTRVRAGEALVVLDPSTPRLQAASAKAGVAQAQEDLALKALTDTTIKAPFAGAVVERRIAPGEFAAPGRAVVVLVKDNPLRFRFDVPENDVAGIKVGQPVALEVAASPGKTFPAVVKRVGASLKTQSRTLPVEAEAPNDSGDLKPGLFARASVELGGDPEPITLVPPEALGSSGASARVFVKKGDVVHEVLVVSTGRRFDGLEEVRGALAANDQVAVTKVADLRDGTPIVSAK